LWEKQRVEGYGYGVEELQNRQNELKELEELEELEERSSSGTWR
jgi:hypothetical protein